MFFFIFFGQDDDFEELEDMTITVENSVIVCAHNADDLNHLET